jgi:hypothetical protein
MSRGTQFATILITGLLISVGSVFIVARFNDGPLEIISGGPFESGEVLPTPEEWSFLKDRMTMELQTMVPPRSRTMWVVVHDNRLYVISRYMKTLVGKVWKQWPRNLHKNNQAVIRVDNNLYELKLVRITDGDHIEEIVAVFNEKYRNDVSAASIASGSTWLFELTGR